MKAYRLGFASSLLGVSLGCGSNEPAQFNSRNKDRVETADKLNETHADSQDATKIILAAIEAHGGELNFAKANIGQTTMTIEGALQPGMSGQFTAFDIFHMPAKHKRVVKGESQGQKLDMNFVINGDEAWMQVNGGPRRSLPIVNPSGGVYPNRNLGELLALKGAGLQLSVPSTENINGRPAYCIRMESNGKWVGDSFFDKETYLLVASKKELFDATIGKLRKIETYYSAYKIVDKLNLPLSMQVVIDGETTAKINVTEIEFMDEIDEAVFAKPVALK